MKRKKDLKAALDDIHSLLVRLEETDDHGWGNCVTCSKTVYYKHNQHNYPVGECGHFKPCRDTHLRWMRENTHLQCWNCNHELRGNYDVYEDKIIELYGVDMLDIINEVDRSPFVPTHAWYEKEIQWRKERVLHLLSEKMIAQ